MSRMRAELNPLVLARRRFASRSSGGAFDMTCGSKLTPGHRLGTVGSRVGRTDDRRGDMAEHLGPLELVGDRWIIEDPKREGGSCLVLTAEGMEHHEPGAPGPRAVILWSKFVELQIRATFRARHATRTMGVLGALGGGHLETGPSGCSVGGTLRSLRTVVAELHPSRAALHGFARLLGEVPVPKDVRGAGVAPPW